MDLRLKVDASGAVSGFAEFDQAANKAQNSASSAIDRIGGAFDRLQSRIFNLKTGAFSLVAALGLDKIAEHIGRIEKIQIALEATLGSSAKARAAFASLGDAARKFGFQADDVALQYAKFLEATNSMGYSTRQAEQMFRGLSAGVRAFGGEAQEVNEALGIYVRLMSRGGVEGTMLLRQLKDVVPGTFTAAAAALGKTEEQFRFMMDKGIVPFRQLMMALPDEIIKRFGDAAEKAGGSISGLKAKLHDALQGVMEGTGAGGFTEAYKRILEKLIEILESPRAQLAAQRFGELLAKAMDKIVEAMDWATKHTDQLKTAFEAMIGLKVAGFFGGIAFDVGNLVKALIAMGDLKAFQWFMRISGMPIGAGLAAVLAVGQYGPETAPNPRLGGSMGRGPASVPGSGAQGELVDWLYGKEQKMAVFGQPGSIAGPPSVGYAEAMMATYPKLLEGANKLNDKTKDLADHTQKWIGWLNQASDMVNSLDPLQKKLDDIADVIGNLTSIPTKSKLRPQAEELARQLIQLRELLILTDEEQKRALFGEEMAEAAKRYVAQMKALEDIRIVNPQELMERRAADYHREADARLAAYNQKQPVVTILGQMTGVVDAAGTALDNFFTGIETGTQRAGESFRNMGNAVIAAINGMLIKMTFMYLLQQAMTALMGVFTGGKPTTAGQGLVSTPWGGQGAMALGFATPGTPSPGMITGGHAIGGPFNPGSDFIVGKNIAERGPEIIHMNGSGSVQPMQAQPVKVNIQNSGTAKDAKSSVRYDPRLKETVVSIVLDDLERNGPMARAGLRR